MNEVQVFNNPDFGDIRTITIDGEPWFVAKDIAEMLGYTRTHSMTKQIDDEDKQLFVCTSQAQSISNMTRKLGIINESGLYTAILGSQLKTAKKFKHWVTKEVLPTIRKTGSYGQPQLPQTPMELLELHYEAIKQVDSKVDEVKAEFEQFKQEIPIFGEECSEINAVVEQKVIECLGGKGSVAYQEKGLHRKLYRDIYGQTNRAFGVSRYKSIKRSQYKDYIKAVKEYVPPIGIKSDIEQANSQQRLRI